MVRGDMHLAKQHLTSERIRLGLGLLTPAEREALAKKEADLAAQQAKVAAKGTPLLFDEE